MNQKLVKNLSVFRKNSKCEPRLFGTFILPSTFDGESDHSLLDNLLIMAWGLRALVNPWGMVCGCQRNGGFIDLSFLPSLLPISWRNRTAGTAHNKLWYASLALVTLIMYSVATGGLILMAVFYTQNNGCLENKILLGINGGLCLLISVVAISPCVQNRKCSFFHSSLFIFFYF